MKKILFILYFCIAFFTEAKAQTAKWLEVNLQVMEYGLIEEFVFLQDAKDMNEVLCLAMNVYHEARGSSLRDQYAVSHVVMNRVKDSRWSNNACQVIWKPYQFSWTNDEISDMPDDVNAWIASQQVAWDVYTKAVNDFTDGSNHYHREDVEPKWSKDISFKKQIGAHYFMKL